MILAKFYNINTPHNVINKPLSNATELNGLFFDTFNELKPRLQIRWNTTPFNFNYVVIGEKSYFIENVSREKNNVITLELNLDVLQTFKTEILNSVGTIVTRENANKFISNRNDIHDVRPQFEKINFSVNSPFDENGNIIMITLKGNA